MTNLDAVAQMAAYAAQILAFVVLMLAAPVAARTKLHEGCSPAVLLLFAICLTHVGFVVRLLGPHVGLSEPVSAIASRVLFIGGSLMVIRVALSWLGGSMWAAIAALAGTAALAITWPLQWWS